MATILTTQRDLRATKHVDGIMFLCADCGQAKPVQTSCGTGYGYYGQGDEAKPVCYACCGIRERADMLATGKAVLYLTQETGKGTGTLTNWPGTLAVPCGVRKGRHNIARVRYDVWFTFEGQPWHGVQYGDNTQLCHCRRVKAH